MSKQLDAIIFGATGFSGKIVVQDAVELLSNFTWGIAGRNKHKLTQVLKEVGDQLKIDLSHIPVIVADVNDKNSIQEMAKQCKILLNCCGPYDLYGEVVVKACIETGTHHVDLSGEPTFIDGMQLKYHDWAKERNVYIVSSCGFDSVASEMGVAFAERQFEGKINSIEMYWENTFDGKDVNSRAVLNSGTWESFIYTVKKFGKVFSLQKRMNSQFTIPERTPHVGLKPYIQKPDFGSSYFLPMPFGDRNIVERSQFRLHEFENKRPIQFEAYIGFRSLFWALFLPFYIPIILLIALMPFCHKLLLRYSKCFTFGRLTHEGPTVATQNGHHFQMTFKAMGWTKTQPLTSPPIKQLLTRVSGKNPFYGFTSVALISAAKIILTESDQMPGSGGVIPPGAAFYRTSLIEELSKHSCGLKFEVLK